ncbi:hypothetical protein F5Y15DRAFT_427168 [Xylariaceae sp. FL0016]|nr:hypothetical protein F5Y15DRAFT_427168 [Xylariaceae sp. FL0016]
MASRHGSPRSSGSEPPFDVPDQGGMSPHGTASPLRAQVEAQAGSAAVLREPFRRATPASSGTDDPAGAERFPSPATPFRRTTSTEGQHSPSSPMRHLPSSRGSSTPGFYVVGNLFDAETMTTPVASPRRGGTSRDAAARPLDSPLRRPLSSSSSSSSSRRALSGIAELFHAESPQPPSSPLTPRRAAAAPKVPEIARRIEEAERAAQRGERERPGSSSGFASSASASASASGPGAAARRGTPGPSTSVGPERSLPLPLLREAASAPLPSSWGTTPGPSVMGRMRKEAGDGDGDGDGEEGGGMPLLRRDSEGSSVVSEETVSEGVEEKEEEEEPAVKVLGSRQSVRAGAGAEGAQRKMLSLGLLSPRGLLDWILGRDLPTETAGPDEGNASGVDDSGGGGPFFEDDFLDIGDAQDMCPACAAPIEEYIDSISFRSSLKLSYHDSESHSWAIGDRYVLHESTDAHPEDLDVTLVEATRLVQRLGVPAPDVLAAWKEKGKVITIAERPFGERLYDIWWTLDAPARESIARQTADFVAQWRDVTSERLANLNGGPVRDHENLLGTLEHEGFGPFRSDREVWRAMRRRLRRRAVDEGVVRVLRDYMPRSSSSSSSSSYVFTHGDLSSAHVYVHKGRVSAIAGFDRTAWLPGWAESVALHFCCCQEDEEWKALLSRHVRPQQAAMDWWSLWTAAEDPETETGRLEQLTERCRRWRKTWDGSSEDDNDEDDDDGGGFGGGFGTDEVLGTEFMHGARRNGFMATQPGPKLAEGEIGYSLRQAIRKEMLRGTDYNELLDNPIWENAGGHDDLEDERDRDEMARNRDQALEQLREIQRQAAAGQLPSQWILGSSHRPSTNQSGVNDNTGSGKGHSERESGLEAPSGKRSKNLEVDSSLSKGLRPLSLPMYALSEATQENLRDTGEENEFMSNSRGESIEDALRSLSGTPEVPADGPAEGAANEEAAKAVSASKDKGKRVPMFTGRIPGGLYAMLLQQGSGGQRPRMHKKSQAEDRSRETIVEKEGEDNTGKQDTAAQ